MNATTIYNIELNNKDVETIRTLMDMLDNCPIDLSNDNYVEIFKSIANEDSDVDVDGIQLSFPDNKGAFY